MSKINKRDALEVLTRPRLIELGLGFELEVTTRSSKDELIDALASSKRASYEAILDGLSRKELKEICRAHDLSDRGKAKAVIIERILGREESPPQQPKHTPTVGKRAKGTGNSKSTEQSAADSGNGGVLGFESQLWGMADQLWTNSGLQPSEYSTPVLALIFLKYADHKFAQVEAELASRKRRRGKTSKDDYLARGVLFVPEEARFQKLLELPEGADVGKAVNDAMKAVEGENPELKDVLPKAYAKFERTTLASLLKIFGSIPPESTGDAFGRIYEYFLGNFAPLTLQKGGEYFTPESVVKLIVEIVEPFHGRILDPACGSGGMFIQSARFVSEHKKNPSEEISVHGIEKISQTLRLTKMNLAVHGLSGDIREANTYYEDPHDCVGKFDFVMANPPFNQNAVDKDRIKDDKRRFPFGMPTPDNANYLWIELFYAALNESGRAGFVMANSAGDARSETIIRQQLLEARVVDVIVSLSTNLFFTVTLPATLWFLDRAKPGSPRADSVLFIDARSIHRQVTKSHREMTPSQIEFLANIVRLYRGATPENHHGGAALIDEHFGSRKYSDQPGLCAVASLGEIAEHGWSLSPGRYVGIAELTVDDDEFADGMNALLSNFKELSQKASELETQIVLQAEALMAGAGK